MTQTKNSNRSSYKRGSSRSSAKSNYHGPRDGHTGRMKAFSQPGKNHKRKPPFDYTKLLIGIAALVILAICIVFISKGFSKKNNAEKQETTIESETELVKEVSVNGVAITGLSREKAKEAVLKNMNWGIKVTFKEDTYQLQNLLEQSVDTVLEEIFTTKEPKESYTIGTDNLEEGVKAEVTAIAAQWDMPAKDAAISGYDAASDKFTFSDEEAGEVIDQEKLQSDIMSALSSGNYQTSITAASGTTQPEITREQARDQYQVIGTYTTTTTTNKDRNTNVSLAAQSFNGKIIKPGEEFSFNTTTGNRTLERGYKPAGAYVNGVLVEEPGGGVCQVSSTLYNAVVFAGLKTTERHAHSYEPSYVTPGEDAMVSYDGYAGPDMKFVNNTKDSIGMKASFYKQQLTISIYGIPVLEDGVKIRMSSKKVSDVDSPAPTYVEDNTLQPGVEVIAKEAKPGSKWVTNIITTKNGEVITDEFFHNSTYKGKPATIKRNTSGTVVTSPAAEGQTETAQSSHAETTAPKETTTASQPTTQASQGPGIATEPAATEPTAQTTAAEPSPTQGSGGNGTIIAPNPLS